MFGTELARSGREKVVGRALTNWTLHGHINKQTTTIEGGTTDTETNLIFFGHNICNANNIRNGQSHMLALHVLHKNAVK